MGRQGIRRRQRRPSGRRRAVGGDSFELQHPPYTLEGELEGFRRFGRGMAGNRGLVRWIAIVVAVAFVLPAVAGVFIAFFG